MFGLWWPLAALQRGLRFNAGSCDYSGRVWKGGTSFTARLWKCFLCRTIRARRTHGPRVLHVLTQTPQAAWTPRLDFASWLTSFQGRTQDVGWIKVTIPIESNHFVTLRPKFCPELIKKKKKTQFHLPFILAELINVPLSYNTISSRLFHLILFLPFFRGSLSLTGLHAATP